MRPASPVSPPRAEGTRSTFPDPSAWRRNRGRTTGIRREVSTATVEAPPRPQATPGVARARVRPPKKRMLIIVNPYATTVSDRLKNLVVYALQGRYEVEAVATRAQNHAT